MTAEGMTDDEASSMDDSKAARNDEYTNGIVNGMYEKLLDLIAKGEECFPDKVWRALNYFYNFWDRIFAYRHDGEYSIDNTFISTCLQKCRSFRDFFVDYVREWNRGRRDFSRSSSTRLLPTGRKNLIKLALAPAAN